MLVILGVIPAFLVAALIEGFVTGRTGAPVVEVALGAIVAVAYVALLLRPVVAPKTQGGTVAGAIPRDVRAGPST